LSENSEGEQKKDQLPQEEQVKASEVSSQEKPKPKVAPRVGTPIGEKPAGTPAPRPTSTTVAGPVVGTPAGTPATTVPRPTSTPVARPVGTAVGTARPTVGTPAVRPGGPPPTPASGPLPPKLPPAKPAESKVEASRRNFIRGLAILGGLAFVASFVPLFPYLQGSVGVSTLTDQQLVVDPDVSPTTPIYPSSVGNGITFAYPYTGNANVDSDTFVQCVLIQLPSGLTIPSSYDAYTAKDSSGNVFIAFSRVCVHLWCLWGTGVDLTDPQVGGPVLGPCPCHGSTYVPGTGGSSIYPKYPEAQNQVPGQAVAGPASLQVFPNNQLPIIKIRIASDGSFHAYGRVGDVGYCQQC
jgi:Rieske Fe-S protein